MAGSSLSINQLSKIEQASKKQLDSISKLQNKLHRTQIALIRNSQKKQLSDDQMPFNDYMISGPPEKIGSSALDFMKAGQAAATAATSFEFAKP